MLRFKKTLHSCIVGAVMGLGLLASTGGARASVINFDDQGLLAVVANGYQGFNWNNMFSMNATVLGSALGPGYANSMTSANNIGFNLLSAPSGFSSASNFALSSISVGAAFNNGITVLFQGYDNGVLTNTFSVVANTVAPTLAVLNWLNIDQVVISSSGGVPVSGSSDGTRFAIDDITIGPAQAVGDVPLPAGVLLLGTALCGIGGLSRRRSRSFANG
jgi:hypothetical protein